MSIEEKFPSTVGKSDLMKTFSDKTKINFVSERIEGEELPGGIISTGSNSISLGTKKDYADDSSKKTLYEQLQANKEKMMAERAALYKNQPPKALDEDEAIFLEQQDIELRQLERKRKQEEDEEVQNFRLKAARLAEISLPPTDIQDVIVAKGLGDLFDDTDDANNNDNNTSAEKKKASTATPSSNAPIARVIAVKKKTTTTTTTSTTTAPKTTSTKTATTTTTATAATGKAASSTNTTTASTATAQKKKPATATTTATTSTTTTKTTAPKPAAAAAAIATTTTTAKKDGGGGGLGALSMLKYGSDGEDSDH